jgi:hypothetical protein
LRSLALLSLLVLSAACNKSNAVSSNDDLSASDLASVSADLAGVDLSGRDLSSGGDLSSVDLTPGAKPAAPLLDSIHGISGGVTIGWTNNIPDADSIEVWRKDALTPYAAIATIGGTLTSYSDTTAKTTTTNYTYKIRCQKNGTFSDYSNEESAMPLP